MLFEYPDSVLIDVSTNAVRGNIFACAITFLLYCTDGSVTYLSHLINNSNMGWSSVSFRGDRHVFGGRTVRMIGIFSTIYSEDSGYVFWDFNIDNIKFVYVPEDTIVLVEKFQYGSGISAILGSDSWVDNFTLEQNYPNPFNPSTKIEYSIPVAGMVSLKVYDLLGKEVATLIDEHQSAGNYEAEFNASNLPSGRYFYKLKIGKFVETKKMSLVK